MTAVGPDESLARRIDEARLFSRYLVGREASPEVLQRYAEALARLPLEPRRPADRSLLAFVRRHPWSLPPLDAALGVARRDSPLRARLLLMLALLEATVEHAGDFLPRPRARLAVVARVAASASLAALEILAGLLLLPFATRGR